MKKIELKRGKKMLLLAVIFIIFAIILIYLSIQLILCTGAVKQAYRRLNSYNVKTAELSCGTMTYIDEGNGDVILVAHGICGGYDQGYESMKEKETDYRIIAPSRFGYLGSTMPKNPSPLNQAQAYIELLDLLKIDKVFILGTSAGGTIAIKFALEFPERTKGLILISTASPLLEKPDRFLEYAGPPKFLCNDFGMWLVKPFFKPIMGMEPDTIFGMLPMKERKKGIINDAAINNPDMSRNFDDYPIEKLQVKSLIMQAKNDKLSDYNIISKAVVRFPNCTFIVFEEGGHMLIGNNLENDKIFTDFIITNR